MPGSVLSGLQQYCSLAAVMSGPAHVILSKAYRAAASPFFLLYPADLLSGWLHLHIRNMGLKKWRTYSAWIWAEMWNGFLPEPDLSTVLFFFLAISQSTSSSTLSTCEMTSSCSARWKVNDGAEENIVATATTNTHCCCGGSLRVDDGKVTLMVHLRILITHKIK